MSFFHLNLWTRAKQISISLMDQGLYSINNFILNIFLARMISPAAYGEYSVVFSIFLFISGFQNALILEPMSVIGPVKYKNASKEYLIALARINILITVLFSLIILIICYVFSLENIATLLIPMAIISPLLLSYWFIRRFCYILQSPAKALIGTSIYSFLLLSITTILSHKSLLNGQNAYYVMGFSGLVAFLLTFVLVYKSIKNEESRDSICYLEIIKTHWDYGKWVTGSAIVFWLNSMVIIPLTALLIGYTEAGAFRALQNFVLPVQQLLIAIGNLLLPSLSILSFKKGIQSLFLRSKKLLLIVLSATSLYGILLYLLRKPLIGFFFPKNNYIQYDWLILFLVFALILDSANQIMSLVLRAIRRPDTIFWSQLGGVFGLLTLGFFMIRRFDLLGAVWANVIISLINLLIIIFFSISLMHHNKNQGLPIDQTSNQY